MALKSVLSKDAWEKLPDFLKSEYSPADDGRYYLEAEDIDDHPKVKNLKTAHETQKKENSRLRSVADRLKDIDADEYAALKKEKEEREQRQAEEKGEFDKLRERLEAQHKNDINKRDEEIRIRDAAIERMVLHAGLDAAIAKAGVLPHYQPAVRALLRERKPAVVKVGDEYKGVFKTDIGDLEIDEYVANWAKTEEAAHYMPASGKGGSGVTVTKDAPPSTNFKGKPETFDRSDPLAWGKNAEKLLKGEAVAT